MVTTSRQNFLTRIGGTLQRGSTRVLQLNVGRLCNQTCGHCHVDAGPHRQEVMSGDVADACVELLDRLDGIETLDLTGGAPEMCPSFEDLVRAGRERHLEVIDRCNLTILSEPGFEHLARFLADHRVRLIASLPCYQLENVDQQRGSGVFRRSIAALQQLNDLGYGVSDPPSELILDLVYNPIGPQLPPPAKVLESAYREQLSSAYGIQFHRLLTITNMPIARFQSQLRRTGQEQSYQTLLEDSFNRATLSGLMCRQTLSVSHDGQLYDCDFNQMLQLELTGGDRLCVSDVNESDLVGRDIHTGQHCFGCTAGAGSSCGGTLV
ncbi:MAG: arsenosugar biosynthesis radical SAM (seleno)protein ArsS [Planctomycetota bacterium]|nr:arsenosugar biosynthesis radical SAM (seleno)protein ArsS [Planctomycetota bacterium]